MISTSQSGTSARAYILDAAHLQSIDDTDGALDVLARALLEYPEDYSVLQTYGELHLAVGSKRAGERYLEKAALLKLDTLEIISTETVPPSEFEQDKVYLDTVSAEYEEDDYRLEDGGDRAASPPLATRLELSKDQKEARAGAFGGTRVTRLHRDFTRHETSEKEARLEGSDEPKLEEAVDAALQESMAASEISSFAAESSEDSPALDPDALDDLLDTDAGLALRDAESELSEESVLSGSFPAEETDVSFVMQGGDENEFDESLFDFWQEEPEEVDLEEDINELAAVVRIGREQRARQIAAECLVEWDWDKQELEMLSNLFVENGWARCRRTIEREVKLGLSPAELALAADIRRYWKDCERFWAFFPWNVDQTRNAIARYSNISWIQVIEMIRCFYNLPDLDELLELLDTEFECWYASDILRGRYPAFVFYLRYYRFNGDFPNLPVEEAASFDVAVVRDGLSAPELTQPGSDECNKLMEMGVDVYRCYQPRNGEFGNGVQIPADARVSRAATVAEPLGVENSTEKSTDNPPDDNPELDLVPVNQSRSKVQKVIPEWIRTREFYQ